MSKILRRFREKAEAPGTKRLKHIDRYFEGFVFQPALHPLTKKPRQSMLYTGSYYQFAHLQMELRKAKRVLIRWVLLYIGLYVLASLLPSIGSASLLCYLPGLFLLFPCIVLLSGLISVLRAGDRFIARYKYSTLPVLKKGTISAFVLNGCGSSSGSSGWCESWSAEILPP